MVTKQELSRWKEKAKEIGATHIISVCDTFDFEDYPVYVMPHEDIEERKKEFDNINMQRINPSGIICCKNAV